MQEIISRIIHICKENDMSGNALGRMLNLKKSPLTDWKNGHSKPTIEQIIAICENFAISTDSILCPKDSIQPTPCVSIKCCNYDSSPEQNMISEEFDIASLSISEYELAALRKYKDLPANDRVEVVEIIDLKYKRAFPVKSSTSGNGKKSII